MRSRACCSARRSTARGRCSKGTRTTASERGGADNAPTPSLAADFVYLASASPRRRQLLEQLGVAYRLLVPDADEDAEALEAERPGERAEDYVCRVTRAKLGAARQRLDRRGLAPAPILCADTTVVLGRRILGKPVDAAMARSMLGALSGRTHRVLTAVALWDGRRSALALDVSRVRMAPLSPALVASYVDSGEPFGKAGAYAIQGPLAGWIAHIEGSHSGIMGLPLHPTRALLARVGLDPLRAARPAASSRVPAHGGDAGR